MKALLQMAKSFEDGDKENHAGYGNNWGKGDGKGKKGKPRKTCFGWDQWGWCKKEAEGKKCNFAHM